MSQENVQMIRRGLEYWLATGEFRAHPDLVWDVSNLGWPDQQAIYRGADGAMEFLAEWSDPWDDWEVEIEDYIDAGECVVSIIVQRRVRSPREFPSDALRNAVDHPGRMGDQDAAVREPGRGPRSHEALAVGDVAGERGDRAAGLGCVSRGDMEEALAAFAPDVGWDVSRDVWGSLVGGGRYRGVEGIQSWLRDLYGAWETFEMAPEVVIDGGGDQVITVLSAQRQGRASGIKVEHHPAGVSTLREGKIVRVVWFPTRAEPEPRAGFRGLRLSLR